MYDGHSSVYTGVILTVAIVYFDISCYIQHCQTPLLRASLRGHAAVVRQLLQKGADVNICDEVCIHTLAIILLYTL